jgi:hypothetical protein
MCQQKNSDGASLREKETCLDRPLTKNQPEMRSKGLVELSTMFNVSTNIEQKCKNIRDFNLMFLLNICLYSVLSIFNVK